MWAVRRSIVRSGMGGGYFTMETQKPGRCGLTPRSRYKPRFNDLYDVPS